MGLQQLFYYLLLPLFLFVNTFGKNIENTFEHKNGKPTNLEALYKEHPEIIYNLFNRLDLNLPGMEKVKSHVDQKEWIAACETLADYYKRKSTGHYLWFQQKGCSKIKPQIKIANDVLRNVFTFQEITSKQPERLDKGGINWNYLGPKEDKEWGYFLNRHGFFNDLLNAYKCTGHAAYAKKFNDLVIDWVL